MNPLFHVKDGFRLSRYVIEQNEDLCSHRGREAKMGVGGCWDGGQQVVTIKKWLGKSFLGRWHLSKNMKKVKEFSKVTWGKSFPCHENSHCSTLRQRCIQGAARNHTDWNRVDKGQSSRKRSLRSKGRDLQVTVNSRALTLSSWGDVQSFEQHSDTIWLCFRMKGARVVVGETAREPWYNLIDKYVRSDWVVAGGEVYQTLDVFSRFL